MKYIWDEDELIQLFIDNEEYAKLVDTGEWDTLRSYMLQDGYEVSKRFLDTVLINAGIDIGDNVVRASQMKYTIIGTEDLHGYQSVPNYRYAGLNNKGIPTTLGKGPPDPLPNRVFFKDYPSAKAFFDNFIEYPKIKNRKTPVHWKITQVTGRSLVGKKRFSGAEMKLVNSPVGDCYQINWDALNN